MEIRILGPTEVRHDGSPVVLRGAKPRQLLVLLSIRANRPVRAEQLIEELWEGDPPPSAATALRVHFGRLRNVLEPNRSPKTASVRLPAGPHGYLLRLEPDELDMQRFERHVLLARDSNVQGDPHAAIRHLTEALDLWRGLALADVRDLSAAQADVARIEELRAVAFEELADARLTLGEHNLVVDVLTMAVDEFPLREKLTGHLMRALYRSGRPLDALRAYAQLSGRLGELGLIPSDALRRLEEDVLLQRPTLDYLPGSTSNSVHHYTRPPAVRMIGRYEELRKLVLGVQAPLEDRPRLHMITGPAGIGKSTLMREFSARMEREGFSSIVGVCHEQSSTPYEPIAQFLQIPSPGGTHDSIPATTRQNIFPWPTHGTSYTKRPESDGKPARYRLFEQVAHNLAAQCPSRTVLIVEDLHFADRGTLLLLRHILRHRTLEDVACVVTFRDDDVAGERLELIESLVSPSRTLTYALRPFHEGEVRSLVRATAPPDEVELLAERASTLRDATGGNPFFLRELLRELDDDSVKLRGTDDLAIVLSEMAPVGVRALVDRRLARLTIDGRRLAETAAAMSEEISTRCLSAVCGGSGASILDAIEECLATRLLIEDVHDLDRFAFPHALVRNAVYASLTEQARRELHQRIAQVLSTYPEGTVSSVTLARHYCEAAPLGLGQEAAEHAENAAIDAEGHLLFGEAAGWYETALEWHGGLNADDRVAARLFLALGRCRANDKAPELAHQAFSAAADAARRVGDAALLADIALAADGPWSSGSAFEGMALGLLEESLVGLTPHDQLRRVRVLNGIAADLYYVDSQREGDVAHEAMEIATRLEDPEAIAAASLALHRWLTHRPEKLAERLALSKASFAQIKQDGPTAELSLLIERAMLADLLESGEIRGFDEMLANYEQAAMRLASPRDIYWAMALRATQATIRGDLPVAEQLARGAALRGHELEQLSDGAHILQRFVIRFEQGRIAEELPALRGAGGRSSVFRAGAALGAIALAETGRESDALKLTWETIGADGSNLPRDVFWLAAIALFSGVAVRAGDPKLQTLLRRLISPCAEHVVIFGVGGAVLGSGHYWLALSAGALGDCDAAVESFSRAANVADRMNAPYWKAQAQIDCSRTLLGRGYRDDRSEATRLARQAVVAAHRFDFGRILAQAADIL